jgi:hypothetical protein
MKNIPTAEETLKNWQNKYQTSKPRINESLIDVMKEFAKLHVEAALQDASEKSTVIRDEEFYTISHVNKNSILNAYPLTNIK